MPRDTRSARFLQLGREHRDAVAAIAEAAFRQNPFYERAVGLDARTFPAYWRAFFELALSGDTAAVYALERDGDIVAAVATGFDGFPRPSSFARFLARLLFELGPGAWWRYVRFALAYGRAMHRPAAERRLEACGLWLFVKPDASSVGLGSRLVREATEAVRRRGKLLLTGFVDAGNRPLLTFYRRNGFRVLPPFAFGGLEAVRVERWLLPGGVAPTC